MDIWRFEILMTTYTPSDWNGKIMRKVSNPVIEVIEHSVNICLTGNHWHKPGSTCIFFTFDLYGEDGLYLFCGNMHTYILYFRLTKGYFVCFFIRAELKITNAGVCSEEEWFCTTRCTIKSKCFWMRGSTVSFLLRWFVISSSLLPLPTCTVAEGCLCPNYRHPAGISFLKSITH